MTDLVHLDFSRTAWTPSPADKGIRLLQGDVALRRIPWDGGRIRVILVVHSLVVAEGGLRRQTLESVLYSDFPPLAADAPSDAIGSTLWIAEQAIGATAGRLCHALKAIADAWADHRGASTRLAIVGAPNPRAGGPNIDEPETIWTTPRLVVAAETATEPPPLVDLEIPPPLAAALQRVARLPWIPSKDDGGFRPPHALYMTQGTPSQGSSHARLVRRRAAAATLPATGLAWPDGVLP